MLYMESCKSLIINEMERTMSKLLQINTVANSGSTGHIAEDIGNLAIANGWESYIAYGRNAQPSSSKLIRIGNKGDILFHVLVTRIFDLHGLASRYATKRFIKQIENIKPDVIQLHNIHGYYLNYKILFKYLANSEMPVVWTMHDCWAETGHCPYYTFVQCIVWQSKEGCKNCPQKNGYPKCVLFSNAAYNFKQKKKYFNLLAETQLTIVTPSKWLSEEIAKSYLGHYRTVVINNGIDLNVFKPVLFEKNTYDGKFIILGVANVWDERKGINDFIKLTDFLKNDEQIIMIGLSDNQRKNLPAKITGLSRTENLQELIKYYSLADVYFNASVEETFGMTNIEAQACGTPVIAYNSTAIPETFSEQTGILVERNNISAVYDAIKKIRQTGKNHFYNKCIEYAANNFDKNVLFSEYINLYEKLGLNKIRGATE